MFYIDKTLKMTWLQHVVVMVILCCFHMEADCVTDEESMTRNFIKLFQRLLTLEKVS